MKRRRVRLRKLVGWLGWAVLVAVVLMAGFVVVASHRGWEFDAVLSSSMEPAFPVGGLVVVKPAAADSIEEGNVISFSWPGSETRVCHRVTDVQTADGKLLFQTKGDANEEPDMELVPAQNLKGTALFCAPYAGYLAHLAQLGSARVPVFGKSVPAGALVITAMGLGVIGLTVRDMVEEIAAPSRRRRRELWEKRQERLAQRSRHSGRRSGLSLAKARVRGWVE